MELEDIIELARTNSQLRSAAITHFKYKYKNEFDLTQHFRYPHEYMGLTKTIFSIFGQQIQNFKLTPCHFWNRKSEETIMKLTFKSCPNLKKLNLKFFKYVTNLIPYTQSLESLTIDLCRLNCNLPKLLINCPKLRELSIIACTFKKNVRAGTFSNLIHSELKTLRIIYSTHQCTTELMKSIHLIYPNITELHYATTNQTHFAKAIDSISQLKNLKIAHINFNETNPNLFLQKTIENNIKIERLFIINETINQTIINYGEHLTAPTNLLYHRI